MDATEGVTVEREQIIKRMQDHPITDALSKAANGRPVHDDDIKAANLPDKIERAMKQALKQVQASEAPREAEELAFELIDALGPEHETLDELRERKASYGDPDALAALQAQEEARERQMQTILERTGKANR